LNLFYDGTVLRKSQGQGGWRGFALKRPRLRTNIADQYLRGMCWHMIILVCVLGAACRAGAVRSGLEIIVKMALGISRIYA
tara:strand:+ start:568 stop:810 length:243 start_codon:yes stop_codon:yes gene_type:complete